MLLRAGQRARFGPEEQNFLALTAQNLLAMIMHDSLATETPWLPRHPPSGGLPTH